MYKDLDGAHYDFLVLGTSTTESIFSSYLSKCGKKVIHFENSRNYGGDTKTFNFKDLEIFIQDLNNNNVSDPFLTSYSLIENSLKHKDEFFNTEKIREYNIDINTKFIYSKSVSTTNLADSNASNYMEFNSIKKIKLHHEGEFFEVPSTKSEIFNSQFLNLEEKQKLLNYIYSTIKVISSEVDVNATVDFGKDIEVDNKYIELVRKYLNLPNKEFFNSQGFSEKLQMIIRSVLGNLKDDNILLLDVMKKTFKFISSLQVYDDSPYLYPLYGSSEFNQALCRMASVYGAIFIVNECLKFSLSENDGRFKLEINDTKENEKFTVTADFLIVNEVYLHSKNIIFSLSNQNYKYLEITGHKEYKLSYYFIIENTDEGKKLEGPNFYIITANDNKYNNHSTIIVNEFCINSYSSPKNRSLFKFDLISKSPDQELLKKIFSIFTEDYLKINPLHKLIYEIAFCQEILVSQNSSVHSDNMTVTQNEYFDFDLDFYYNQFEKLKNKHGTLSNLTEIQPEKQYQNNYYKDDAHDDLINELFNEFTIDSNNKEK